MKEYHYHLDISYADPPRYGDTTLIQIGRLFFSDGSLVEKHLHQNWFELTIVTDGEGAIETNGVSVPVKSGDIYLSFPAELHAIAPKKGGSLCYDFFSFRTENQRWAAELEKIMDGFPAADERVFSDERITSLVGNCILEFCGDKNEYDQEILTHMFEQIVIYLIRAFKGKEKKHDRGNMSRADVLCYQTMNYIDTHIFVLKNLADLGEATNYNYSYLSAVFKKTTGRTILDYYQNARLKTAKSLVKENKLKIYEIAELLNYTSVYAFSKAYKKRYGAPPTAERN